MLVLAALCSPLGHAEAGADAAEGAGEVLRPVCSAFTAEVSSSHLIDTYLTPLKYSGWSVGLQYERLQAMKFSPDRWCQQLTVAAQFDRDANPARNATMLGANIAAHWAMMRRWPIAAVPSLSLWGGGQSGVNIGGLYLRRNGNNPATAKADWTVAATGGAVWRVSVGRMPVILRWQTVLPVAGVFFSPDYDELYYEIYLGNRSGLVHAAWWGDFFRWDNLLTADLDVGSATRLRLGFRQRYLSTKVSNITSRWTSYTFVIGVSGDWLGINPRRGLPSPQARTVYALY